MQVVSQEGFTVHVCGVVCAYRCVCDGLEKEDKWSVATEGNDFIQQTALRIF